MRVLRVTGRWIRSDTGATCPLECSHPRKPSKPRGARTLLRYGHLKMGLITGYGPEDPQGPHPENHPRKFLEIFQQVLMRRDPLNTIARHKSGWPRIRVSNPHHRYGGGIDPLDHAPQRARGLRMEHAPALANLTEWGFEGFRFTAAVSFPPLPKLPNPTQSPTSA